MAIRRKPRRHQAQLAFESLSIEGGLLSPEWLGRVAQLGAGSQAEADYRIPKGLNLRDDIGRYWRIAQAHWSDFATGRAAKADAAKLSERFVLALLRDCFGFGTLLPSEPIDIAGRSYPVRFRALGGRVPVIIAPAELGLDTAAPAFGEGGRRRSAFGLAQELLNADENALWALATDGVYLRILRDNGSLTRPAWIEADLGRIFAEERYADFAALWLLAHESRFGSPDKPVTECPLEAWRSAGREEGTRAREHLRRGVEDALLAFGQGFLSHPENTALRSSLHDGSLTTNAYFQELLRLVYRLLFLLTAEERDVLHPPSASEAAKALFAQGYGVRRLRDRSVRRSAHDRFSDLWQGLQTVFRGLARGEDRLGLPALGGLFAVDQCADLDGAKLENRSLLYALFRLSWLREDTGLSRVNWRDMGPEELGSVYESLLELVPQITEGGRKFAFATGAETKGNARKTSGSYYTPDSLVQVLLDSALEPVIADTIARNPEGTIEALLNLSIVDPACGSGHFLLSAARRLAGHVARLTASGTPSAAEYRHALRQVVGRCIFGVDLNPMAVELCKVSLWMEAVEPGRPLSFLDAHIQCGNSLLGATPELMAKGIPDAAWESIEGDDKKIASALKKQNKADAKAMTLDFGASPASTYARLGEGARAVDEATDESLDAVESKEKRWDELVASAAYDHAKFVADLWCSAFVWRKEAGFLQEIAPTDGRFRAIQAGQPASAPLRVEVARLEAQNCFLHWHLAFPQIHARGGFDVLLGNPPWERLKLQEQEFFASRSEKIASATNAAARKKLVGNLPVEDPALWAEWCAASRRAGAESQFIRQSGRYPLCGKGDVNTFAVFAEHNRASIAHHGWCGFIVPTGIATDDTTKEYFGALVSEGRLSSLYDFRNHDGLFYDVGHRRFRFCLITLSGSASPNRAATLVFFAEAAEDVRDSRRRLSLTPQDFETLNPNTHTCPTFRSRRDADINLAMYRRVGVLCKDDVDTGNRWALTIRRHLDMNKPEVLRICSAHSDDGHVVVYEAKMLHQFNHRFGDHAKKPAKSQDTQLPDVPNQQLVDPRYRPIGRYWVAKSEISDRMRDRWTRDWILVWRDICRSTDERTAIATVLPLGGTDFTLRVASTRDPRDVASLLPTMNTFVFDYAVRQKNGGTHLSDYITKQCPVPAPSRFTRATELESDTSVREWLLPRVIELTYTAWDLEPFAHDVGYDGPPFRWDPDRRFLLRCELDAAFFHLYGLSRDDTDYVMDTFPIVRKNDEKAHGEYRTKRVILEIYDAMAEAARTGKPYATRLDPPPADPRVAHPASTRPEWAKEGAS